jgi:putative ABC transport system permease protein
MPYAQEDSTAPLNLVMRSSMDAAALTRAVRQRVRAIDPDIAVVDLTPMTAHTAEVLMSERFAAVLLTVLAAAGLLLATLGLYGAISHVVLSKRVEMALRIAVGAPRAHVVGMVVREVTFVAVTGIIAGGTAAALASRTLSAILYDVAPYDGLTYAGAAALIAIVSGLTAWAPAVRAATVDPASLLR